jgi:cytoskeletal protein RodZ
MEIRLFFAQWLVRISRVERRPFMHQSLKRFLALGVVLAVPAGLFAQAAQTTTETKSSTNPVTGTQKQTTETKDVSNADGQKKTTTKKKVKKHSKKKSSDSTKTTTETKPSGQ